MTLMWSIQICGNQCGLFKSFNTYNTVNGLAKEGHINYQIRENAFFIWAYCSVVYISIKKDNFPGYP